MRIGLSARFWWLMLVAMLACLLLGVVTWRKTIDGIEHVAKLGAGTIHQASVESERRRALTVASMLADALVNPLYYFDLVSIAELAQSALAQPDVAYVLVYDGDGRIVHDGSREIERFGQRMGDPLAATALGAQGPLVQDGDGVIDAAVPVWLARQRIGGLRVGISMDATLGYERRAAEAVRASADDLERRLARIGLGLLLAVMVLAPLVGWMIVRNVVRPVQRLSRAAKQIERGEYGHALHASRRDDEIGELERAFVSMADSVHRHDQEIRRLAFGDILTGLPNRAALRDTLARRLEAAGRSGEHVALLFIDLDEFKRINDTRGHDAGDEAIMEFGLRIRRVTEAMTPNSVDLARFGGDEFVIVVSGDTVRDRAARLAKALLAELRQPVFLDDHPIVLAASIGIAMYPQDADQASSLLKNADIAMYRAKLDGKNCHRFYTRNMEQVVEQQMQMEQDLRLALERGELSVVYQPIESCANRHVLGAEALVRWNHPQRGMIGPDVFIPVAEQSGQIEAIGRFVLLTACRDAAEWPLGSGPGFVSVNVSAWQLQRSDLPALVEEVLHMTELAPQRLHLEFTETAVLANEAAAIAASTRLRELGVKIWLDDFGTGFSGLSQLRRVPVDGVKVDRSFVADMLTDPGDLALTVAIIAMAHSLGIVVTAEGVETAGQFEELAARGCDNMQGFWLGRPMPNAEFMRHLV